MNIGKDGVSAGVAGVNVDVGKDGVSAGVKLDAGPLGHVNTGVSVSPDGVNAKVDAEVHAGVVDANAKVDAGKDGTSVDVGGKVNVEGIEVGGNVGVAKNGSVSGNLMGCFEFIKLIVQSNTNNL